jgi:hypothetical protein
MMTEQEKRAAIRKYFAPFPKWTLWCIGFGVLCLLTGSSGGIVMGLVLVGVGGGVLYLRTTGISDEEFDRLGDEDLQNAAERAFKKWDIDKSEIPGIPIRISGPSFTNTGTQAVKRGKDGIVRMNPIQFAVLGFAEHQLLAYIGVLDMITGNVLNEETEEFFYRDVVSVSTKTDSVKFTHKGETRQYNDTETFVLTTSGATSIRVPLWSPSLASILGGSAMPTTRAQAAIASVRTMLREKKSGAPAI